MLEYCFKNHSFRCRKKTREPSEKPAVVASMDWKPNSCTLPESGIKPLLSVAQRWGRTTMPPASPNLAYFLAYATLSVLSVRNEQCTLPTFKCTLFIVYFQSVYFEMERLYLAYVVVYPTHSVLSIRD